MRFYALLIRWKPAPHVLESPIFICKILKIYTENTFNLLTAKNITNNYNTFSISFYKNFFRPSLNVVVFLPILGSKYSCIILKL